LKEKPKKKKPEMNELSVIKAGRCGRGGG